MQRVQAALVALGEKLRFVSRHVDLDGALGFAGLAAEAEVESLMDCVALKAFTTEVAGEHLPQQTGAAAGGVLLLAGGTIAGTHDAARGFAACADTHAAFGGTLQRSLILGEDEVSFSLSLLFRMSLLAWDCRRRLASPQGMAQVLKRIVDAHGVDQLAGIHAIVGIPQGFELAKSLHQLRTKHLGQQGGTRLAIAMFAA